MQNRKNITWVICSVILLLAGCTTTPQVLRLDLQPKAPSTSVTPKVPVVVRVQDKRTDKVIGYQTNENGEKQGPIVALGDVSKSIYQALTKGLRAEGFIPKKYTNTSEQKTRLTVTLQTLSYTRNHGQIKVVAKLKAHVETPRKTYTATYTVRRKKGQDLLRSKQENRKLINDALNEALNSLLNDQKLIAIMAGHAMQKS